jgi:hypothetical protein
MFHDSIVSVEELIKNKTIKNVEASNFHLVLIFEDGSEFRLTSAIETTDIGSFEIMTPIVYDKDGNLLQTNPTTSSKAKECVGLMI